VLALNTGVLNGSVVDNDAPPTAAAYQFKVPPQAEVTSNDAVEPVHIVTPGATGAAGVGLTVIVNVCAVPAQLAGAALVGVTVTVTTMGAAVAFVAVNVGIFPVPVADAMPMPVPAGAVVHA
jgi:hypothetical protein